MNVLFTVNQVGIFHTLNVLSPFTWSKMMPYLKLINKSVAVSSVHSSPKYELGRKTANTKQSSAHV